MAARIVLRYLSNNEAKKPKETKEKPKKPKEAPKKPMFSSGTQLKLNQLQAQAPTIGRYSMAGILLVIYFCDWKAVLRYVPFYGGKYHDRTKVETPEPEVEAEDNEAENEAEEGEE